MPSDLYRFLDRVDSPVVMTVNGTPVDTTLEKGYVRIARQWRAGDTVELVLPMPVRRVVANEKVEADRNRVALQRGPIVFAAEWADNPADASATWCSTTRAAAIATSEPDLLGGVDGRSRARCWRAPSTPTAR